MHSGIVACGKSSTASWIIKWFNHPNETFLSTAGILLSFFLVLSHCLSSRSPVLSSCALFHTQRWENSKYRRSYNFMEFFVLNSSRMSFQATVSILPKAFTDYILARSPDCHQSTTLFALYLRYSHRACSISWPTTKCPEKWRKSDIFLYTEVKKQELTDILFTFFF